jgi:hypothetical protein
MTTAQALLTPTSDTTPATVSVSVNELSGAQWVSRFAGSNSISDCSEPFQSKLASFVTALKDAGAMVKISATLRPPERAYMMHWCWLIAKGKADPQKIPSMEGVHIKWGHEDDGKYSKEKSISAAKDMLNGFGMQKLGTAPALDSKHTRGLAVDMNVTWVGTLTIKDANDKSIIIKTKPTDGMNKELHAVSATYGVIKYNAGGIDKPHWSDTGN